MASADETGAGALRPADGDVEPVFGQIKEGRSLSQFLLRGLEKVNREWLLICTGHNLPKLFRLGARLSGNGRCNGRRSKQRSPRLIVGKSLNMF